MTIPNFNDLDAALAGPEPDYEAEPEAPPDAEHADRMLVRLRMIRREREQDRAAAETRISQIVDWQAEREGRYLAREEWLVGALERYHQAVLRLDPRALTIHLPSGDLPSRMGQAQWGIDDETVVDWLIPEAAREALSELAAAYVRAVDEVLTGCGVEGLLRVPEPEGPRLDRNAFKAWATTRDEKDRPVAWGVSPSGDPVPGVTVTPPERHFPPPKLRGADEVERFDDDAEGVA